MKVGNYMGNELNNLSTKNIEDFSIESESRSPIFMGDDNVIQINHLILEEIIAYPILIIEDLNNFSLSSLGNFFGLGDEVDVVDSESIGNTNSIGCK